MDNLEEAVTVLQRGGVIAYPTEGMFGLGCDPFNESAVRRIATIKKRSLDKGMILIAAHWRQVEPFVKDVSSEQKEIVKKSWPGHTTWLFPASAIVPTWIKGDLGKVALRVPNHEIARGLCAEFNTPIVSTSANIHGEPPCKSAKEVKEQLAVFVDFVVEGEIGQARGPSTIRDLATGKNLR